MSRLSSVFNFVFVFWVGVAMASPRVCVADGTRRAPGPIIAPKVLIEGPDCIFTGSLG